MITIREALAQGVKKLSLTSDSPHIDAELLLMFILGKTRVYLFTYPESVVKENQLDDFYSLITKREEGWPIAYLIQKRDFWNLQLSVSQATLIPRPETELLVERALTHLYSITNPTVLELGTGSGAISLALASERPDCKITAVDICNEALKIAKENAARLQLTQVVFKHSNWFTTLNTQEKYHLIIANPPYLAENDPHLFSGDLRFEPKSALISKQEGLADIINIVENAIHYLRPAGWLCIEHGYTQAHFVQSIFTNVGYHHVQTHLDIQGHGRMTEGTIKAP